MLGFAATAATWAVILALGFEFARIMKAYDYKTFFVALLGPFWRLFEILYVLIALLVLSVLGSAAGRMVAISFGDAITSTLEVGQVDGGWLLDGVRYAAYNLVAFAAVLFVLPSLKTRREAILSGALAGAISVIPGVLVFVAMLARYPDIQQQAVPVVFLLQTLNVVWLSILFQVVLFGTFVETGVGIIHAINERIAAAMTASGRAFPHWARFVLAIVFLATAIFLAEAIGIIDLIAGGYGILSYAFIAIVVAPLLTIGLFKIAVAKEKQTEEHRVSCNQ